MKIKVTKIKEPILKANIKNFRLFSKDALWAYHPCVVNKGQRYYMFYTGKSIRKGISHNLCLAVSRDLKNWTKVSKTPIERGGNKKDWDSDFVAHSFVFKDGKKFCMLYDGSKKGKWLEEIGLAKSRDLITWKKYEKNPIFKIGKNFWERRHVSRCCIFKEKGIYYLFYAGHDGERERIGLAVGKRLTNLKRLFENPVLDLGKNSEWDAKSISDPKVIKYKGRYLMFYSGIDKKGIERIGVSESLDLKNWKKYKNNPILDVSDNDWDRISAARADVKVFKDKIYIFYSGRRNYFYHIGMAKLSVK